MSRRERAPVSHAQAKSAIKSAICWRRASFTHQVRKSPRFAGDSEFISGPYPISSDELVVAEAALAPWAERLLYARVDLARDDHGEPRVMEVELTEPSLFFAFAPSSAARFAAALARRIAAYRSR